MSHPSSYIKTTSSQATRAQEQVSRTLGQEFNPNAFSVVLSNVEMRGDASATQRIVSINDGTNSERIAITRSSLITVTGGSADVTSAVANIPQSASIAMAWDGSILTIYINGEQWYSDQRDISPELFNTLMMGRDPSFAIEGCIIESVAVYPRALSQSELITLTTTEV